MLFRKFLFFPQENFFFFSACAGRKQTTLEEIMNVFLFRTWGRGALHPLMVKMKEKKKILLPKLGFTHAKAIF